MLRTNYPKNITASCTNCTKLLFCRLKNDIQHPTILVCDFAKEGCVKYEGEGKQTRGLPRMNFISVREILQIYSASCTTQIY